VVDGKDSGDGAMLSEEMKVLVRILKWRLN